MSSQQISPTCTSSANVAHLYRFVVVLEGDLGVSPLKGVVGGVVPGNIVNPVCFVIVPLTHVHAESDYT